MLTNMEHVEVLRDLSEVCRAAIKAGDWKVDGACDPDAALRRADAAIASLSAQQPPAEAQPPSAPVGVEIPSVVAYPTATGGTSRRVDEWLERWLETCDYHKALVYKATIKFLRALAQQPAAVDGAMVERLAQAVATELYGEPPQPGSNSLTRAMMLPGIKRALTATLAAQQGGSDND